MIRWLLWAVGGMLLGCIVHLGTVLILPRMATLDAYSRLATVSPVNTIAPVPPPTPENAILPLMDPAFAAVVCRYDLSNGPIKLTVPAANHGAMIRGLLDGDRTRALDALARWIGVRPQIGPAAEPQPHGPALPPGLLFERQR